MCLINKSWQQYTIFTFMRPTKTKDQIVFLHFPYQILKYVCSKIQVNNNKVEVHIFEWSQFWDKIEMCDIYTRRGETWGNMSITRTQSSETLSPNMSWGREQKGDLCKLQLAACGWARQHVSANCWATVPGWRVIIPDTTTYRCSTYH